MVNNKNFFRTFCKISKAIGTAVEKDEILDLIVTSAIEAMSGKAACLFLADEEGDVFVPMAQKGLSDSYLHAKPERARKVVPELLKEGYLTVEDATADPRLENHEAKKAEGIASILVVPVMVRDRAIGVLSLYSATPRKFSTDEIEFLSALAEQGGMAIEQARLLSRIRNNSMLFLDLAANINSSLDIKGILHILTADIAEALAVKGVYVRLYNEETDEMELVASYGLSEGYLAKGPVYAGKSPIQKEVLGGRTVIVKNIRDDKRIQYQEEAEKEGIVSLLCTPVRSKADVIGVMVLCSGYERHWSDDEVIMVNALAHQGGLAIQNASMYLALECDMKDLKDEIWSHRSYF